MTINPLHTSTRARAYHMHLPALARVLVCSGFIVMSIFLSVVFSKGAFR